MLMARNRRRWGDNDIYFGPLTFAFRERWRGDYIFDKPIAKARTN